MKTTERFVFRPLVEADYRKLLAWLRQPHVLEWWDEGEDTLSKVEEAYGPEEGLERFILVVEREGESGPREIGFFQYYKLPNNVVGIDQFIGEPDCIGRGLGTAAVKEFVRFVFERVSTDRIILDPEPDNKRAIRCYENAGFRHYETRINSGGKTAYLMEILRRGAN